jgi:hypothetical protein
MMRTFVRSIALMALTAVVAAGCGAAAPAATTTPMAAQAAAAATPTPTQVPAATLAPSPDPTGTPLSATPLKSVGPMDAAYVTGTGAIVEIVSAGTTTEQGSLSHVEGIALKGTVTASDARVSGTTEMHLSGLGAPTSTGGVGFEWGTLKIVNPGGAWEGTVRGAIWADANASDLAGWLVGSGAYTGLSYYLDLRGGSSAESIGVIMPVPPPAMQ